MKRHQTFTNKLDYSASNILLISYTSLRFFLTSVKVQTATFNKVFPLFKYILGQSIKKK